MPKNKDRYPSVLAPDEKSKEKLIEITYNAEMRDKSL